MSNLNRDNMTEMCYPRAMTVEEFCHELEHAIKPFIVNMKNMNLPEKRYIEDWMSTFQDWMDIEARIEKE